MQLSDFDFDLPQELIALRPVRPRPASRLLVANGRGPFVDAHVQDLGRFLRPGDLLVLNDTRVIPARLFGMRRRETADGAGVAHVEATLIERIGAAAWTALVRPAKRLRMDDQIMFGDRLQAEVRHKGPSGQIELAFNCEGQDLDRMLEDVGQMPLPPYIAKQRQADEQDRKDYQTVFARRSGAVAAPTASLHFDQPLLDQLIAQGIDTTHVTLHVGAGTFLPVTVDDIRNHKMHSEWGEVTADAAQKIARTKASGGRVIPVGTTALRLIETAGRDGVIQPWTGDTDIFITPGFTFTVADGLMTNFHLPKSTLMMLVSALMGVERIRQIYSHAIETRYRFFSYGDSSLLLPDIN